MLALLATLALLASASAQQICNVATKGQTTGRAVRLPDVLLKPDTQTFDVTIPTPVCPYPESHVGTTLTACDDVVAPDVYLLDLTHGVVTRHHYDTPGVLYTTVYCA